MPRKPDILPSTWYIFFAEISPDTATSVIAHHAARGKHEASKESDEHQPTNKLVDLSAASAPRRSRAGRHDNLFVRRSRGSKTSAGQSVT